MLDAIYDESTTVDPMLAAMPQQAAVTERSIYASATPRTRHKEPRANAHQHGHVPTNPYAQWGTTTESDAWVANQIYHDPTGDSMMRASPVLASIFDMRHLRRTKNLQRWKTAVTDSVAAEDDGVRFLGKQHKAAHAAIGSVWDTVAHADRAHIGVSKVALYSTYQSLRLAILWQAQRQKNLNATQFCSSVQSVIEGVMQRKLIFGHCNWWEPLLQLRDRPPRECTVWAFRTDIYRNIDRTHDIEKNSQGVAAAQLSYAAQSHLLTDTGCYTREFADAKSAAAWATMVHTFCYMFVSTVLQIQTADKERNGDDLYTEVADLVAQYCELNQ
jgi:hypothetical protein